MYLCRKLRNNISAEIIHNMGKNNKLNNKKTKWEYQGKKDLVIPLDASPWEVLQMVGVPVNPYTQSYKIRPLNAKYGVKNSWHKVPWKGSKVYGSAVDLTPASGYTYEDIFKALAHPEVLKWAKHNGFGLHDERTKAALAKTNGTGFHVHFGPNKTNLTVNPFITPYFSYWLGLGMGNTASVVAPDNIPQSTDIYVQDPQYQQLPYIILPEQQDFDWSTLTSDTEEEYVPVNTENTNPIALYLLPYLFSDLRLNDFIKPKEDGIKIRMSANGGQLNLFGKGSKVKSRHKSDNDWELMYELSKPIYQQFIDAGIDPMIAVGVLGNIALESGFNHKASNKTHWGYVLNDKSLTDYVTSNYGGYGPEQQIQYLIDGLTKGIKGSDKGRGKAIQKRFTNFLNAAKGVTDPADIAKLWDDYYEISGGLALYDRKNYATKFWSRYNVPKTQQIAQQIVQETPLILLFLQSPLNIAAIYTEPLVRQPIELVKQQPSTLQLAMMMAEPDLYTTELDGIDLVKELFEPLGIKHTNKKEDNSEEHNYKIKMSFAEGGILNLDKDAIMSDYDTWINYLMLKKPYLRGEDFYNDNTYNYRAFFEESPEEAYKMLLDNEEAHFTDSYKTVNHPTFSTESNYSGYVNEYNPNGIEGGTWSETEPWTYTFSPSQIANNWNIPNTIDYVNDAENNGVTLYMPDGTLPKYAPIPFVQDDNYFGGVLPNVVVTNANGGKVNKYDDGGITNPLTIEELALLKAQLAKSPKSNYEDAVDFDVNPISKLKVLIDKGVSNCMLTASQFYNPQWPISGIRTVLTNPESNGFYQVNEKYAVPGSLIIASMPGTTDNMQSPRHAMILSGYAENDYDFPFKGQMYHVSKGDPLINYSRGKRSADEYVKNVPLKAYIDNSYGKTDIRYFRPFNEGFPAKLLPEIIVTPYGNITQQLNNREISSYAKPIKISPITEEQIQNLMKNINPVSSTKVVTKRR